MGPPPIRTISNIKKDRSTLVKIRSLKRAVESRYRLLYTTGKRGAKRLDGLFVPLLRTSLSARHTPVYFLSRRERSICGWRIDWDESRKWNTRNFLYFYSLLHQDTCRFWIFPIYIFSSFPIEFRCLAVLPIRCCVKRMTDWMKWLFKRQIHRCTYRASLFLIVERW